MFDFGLGSMGPGKAARGIRRSGKAGRRPSTAVGDGDSGDQVGFAILFLFISFLEVYIRIKIIRGVQKLLIVLRCCVSV